LTIFLNALFLATILSHFTVDLLNGQRAVLFAYLSVPLGLTNADLGLYSMGYALVGSLIQPVFGYLTDRVGPRWTISGGVLWMGVFFTAGILTPGVPGLLLLVAASMGSGMFHPAGTMEATLLGRKVLKGKETTAASYFFLFGQLGLFLGPLLSGLILDAAGVNGLLWMVALAVPVAFFGASTIRGIHVEREPEKKAGEKTELRVKRAAWVLVAFAFMATFQSWASQNMITYLPKYLSDLGRTPAQYGVLAAMYMGGSVVGGVIGGSLADRYGRRKVAAAALAMATIPFILISQIGWSPWLYLLIPLAGALTGSTHSIIVVLAQRLIPSGMALASGLILGFMFASGALGAWLSGYFADLWGFPLMFLSTAGLVLAASGLSISLQQVEAYP
jgi:FSR family fosmidomycin resistance protein-like MFS transporter